MLGPLAFHAACNSFLQLALAGAFLLLLRISEFPNQACG